MRLCRCILYDSGSDVWHSLLNSCVLAQTCLGDVSILTFLSIALLILPIANSFATITNEFVSVLHPSVYRAGYCHRSLDAFRIMSSISDVATVLIKDTR